MPVSFPTLLRKYWYWCLIALASLYGFVIEPHWVRVSHHQHGQGSGPVLRVLQLSDVHLSRWPLADRVMAWRLAGLKPDVIVITGDTLDRAERFGMLAPFLASLPEAPVKLMVMGNWEHWAMISPDTLQSAVSRHGYRLLINEHHGFEHQGRRVTFIGLDDATAGSANLVAAGRAINAGDNLAILQHSPGYRDGLDAELSRLNTVRAKAGGAPLVPELMLSGHTHGGQLALLGYAPKTPLGSGAYVAGWYRQGGVPLYVTRGVGTSVLPLRMGAPPEVALIEWRLK